MAKGRRKITQAFYDSLVKAYREKPGNYNQAARAAQCDYRTAKKGWEMGWPKKSLPPIKDVLHREQVAARAAMDEEKAREKAAREADQQHYELSRARKQAVEERTEMGRMIDQSRRTAMGALGTLGRLLPGLVEAAEAANRKLVEDARAGNVQPKDVTLLAQRMASAIRQSNEAARLSMLMQQLHLGLPTEISGSTQQLTIEQVAREYERANRAVERAQKRGLLVLEGGKGKDEDHGEGGHVGDAGGRGSHSGAGSGSGAS